MAKDISQFSIDDLKAYIKELEAQIKQDKKYGLVWDKENTPEQVVLDCKEKIPTLVEDGNKRLVIDGVNNILIEGDNFHALSSLCMVNANYIDLIYIDPPYNRGKNDFVYNDNYVNAEDGYKHSKWLSFMSKRLKLAKNLLKESGLIFISIDDYEFAQLKLLCDQLFGESNFINCFIWQRNSSGKTEKEKFTVNTEYVFLYGKTKNHILNPAYKPLSDSTKKMYVKDDEDGRGKYRLYPLQKPKSPGPETTYDYIDNNGKIWPCPVKGWRIKYEKMKALENDGRLCLENKQLSEKAYWNERDSEGKRIDTLWNDLSENSSASKDLENIIGKVYKFDNPKPTDLIKRCIEIGPKDGVVLDFFAGSGTTGQAVLELNKEDGGNRRFILCTNNENGICENVTYPRLKTVITGIRPDGTKYSDGIPANLRYFKTDFVKDQANRDSAKYALVEKCNGLLCILEDCFDLKENKNAWFKYESSDKCMYIFNDYYDKSQFDEMKESIKSCGKKVILYVYSTDETVDSMLIEDLKNVEMKPIPTKIYEIYKEIVESIKRG